MNVSSFPQAVSAQRTRYCGIWLYINFSTHSRKNGWNDRKNRKLWTPTVKYHTTQKYDIQNGVNWVWCRMSTMQALCTYRQEDHQFKSSSPLLGIQDQSETKEIPANQTKKKKKTKGTTHFIINFFIYFDYQPQFTFPPLLSFPPTASHLFSSPSMAGLLSLLLERDQPFMGID